jgi:glucokinase
MPTAQKFVGLDVGGTTMKAAVVDDAGKASPSVSMDTHPERGQEAGLETMCETIRRAVKAAKLEMKDIAAIGVATPGLMDLKAGLILDPPNLAPWKNVRVREHVAKVFGKPTAFQNDANAAAYGEFWVGAGQTASSMVMFTLGTGVGGGWWKGSTATGPNSDTCGSTCPIAGGCAGVGRGAVWKPTPARRRWWPERGKNWPHGAGRLS